MGEEGTVYFIILMVRMPNLTVTRTPRNYLEIELLPEMMVIKIETDGVIFTISEQPLKERFNSTLAPSLWKKSQNLLLAQSKGITAGCNLQVNPSWEAHQVRKIASFVFRLCSYLRRPPSITRKRFSRRAGICKNEG